MATSGTRNWDPAEGSIVLEAFERIQIEPTQLTRHHLASARRSLNYELLSWSNRGLNLWEMTPFTIQLQPGVSTYVSNGTPTGLPLNILRITEMYFSTLNAAGPGSNIDRIMIPISRDEYAAYPQKQIQSVAPTVYWYQKLEVPQVTIWQVPSTGYPTYAVSGYCLLRVQDANMTNTEQADIPYLFQDALCAGVAKRLAQKFRPDLFQAAKAEFDEAWELASSTSREDAPLEFHEDLSGYWRP